MNEIENKEQKVIKLLLKNTKWKKLEWEDKKINKYYHKKSPAMKIRNKIKNNSSYE